MRTLLSKRAWLVVGALVVAAGVVSSSIILKHRREASFAARVRDAQRTIEILTPLVSADSRFQNVRVTFVTGPGVFLVGTVASLEDFEALRRLVEQASVPFRASFSVSVDSKPPNHALQRTRHGVVVCSRCVPRAGSLSLGR